MPDQSRLIDSNKFKHNINTIVEKEKGPIMVTKATHSMKPSVILPAKRLGNIPPWPLKDECPDLSYWEELWRYGQAVEWERTNSYRLVARYLLLSQEVGRGSKFLAEIRSLEDRLGLSPKSLAALRWVIKDEVGDSGSTGDSSQVQASSARQRPRVTD